MQSNRVRRFLPFGYKLMLSYSLFTMIPVLIVGFFAHAISIESIRKNTSNSVLGTLAQLNENIAYKLEDVERISDMIYKDKQLEAHLKYEGENWESYEAIEKYLKPRYEQMIVSTSLKLWLSVYLRNETLPEIYYIHEPQNLLKAKGPFYEQYHLRRIESKEWYLEHPAEVYEYTRRWKQIENDQANGTVSFLRRIVQHTDPVHLTELGFMRIVVSLSDLFQGIDYEKIGEGSTIFIADESGRVLFQSGGGTDRIGKDWRDEASDNLVIQERVDGLGYSFVALVPNGILEADVAKVRVLTVIVCLICFVVFFFIGMFVSRFFSVRVTKIVSVLGAFREGDFLKRMSYKGNDEFAQIAAALNEMGQNTGDLIREVYLTGLQKKEAELETLQAQINPHFLYNTLSSISRLAKFGEVDKLHNMVIDLAKFYRLSLNEGRTVIPVEKELEQAMAYVNIQRIKHGDRMQVLLDVQPDILGYDTIKLILQPIVENVLEHAWYGDRIHMRIVGYSEGDAIVFKVIDDGVGIHPDLIRQIFDPRDKLNVGYGIRNVDQRIKLHFGKSYGVSIYSRPGIGTTVLIRVPAKKIEQSP